MTLGIFQVLENLIEGLCCHLRHFRDTMAEVLGEQTKRMATIADFNQWAKTLPTEIVDGVIVNNELLEFVSDPKKLAHFVQAALTVIRPDGLLIVRQDLCTHSRLLPYHY